MREIKFRGKTADGEWVYGDYHHRADGECIIEWQPTDEGKVSYVITRVVPDTLGMFTGLYDKDGKEVYEGDVIKEKLKRARKYGERLVVCFGDFEWKAKNTDDATTSLSLLAEYHTIEVIGNIYDNPELMES